MKKFLAFGLGVLVLAFCFACGPNDEPYVPNPNPENGTEQNGGSQGGGNANGGGSLDDNELPMVPFK